MNIEFSLESSNEINFPSKLELINIDGTDNFFRCNVNDVDFNIHELASTYPDMASNFDPMKIPHEAEIFLVTTYLALSSFQELSPNSMNCIAETLTELCKELIPLLTECSSNPTQVMVTSCYKRLLYLFQQLCIIAEQFMKSQPGYFSSDAASGAAIGATKGKKSKKATSLDEGFSWQFLRVESISVLEALSKLPLKSYFPMGIVPENFISTIWNFAIKLLQDRPIGVYGTGHKETSLRSSLIQIIVSTVGHMNNDSYSSFIAAALDAILHAEHMATYIAEILSNLRTAHAGTGRLLITEFVGDLSHMNMQSLGSTGVKNIALFIETFGKLSPESFIEMFPTMVLQLDSPVFQIRSSILHAFGYIVEYAYGIVSKQSSSQEQIDIIETSEYSPQNTATVMRFRDSVLDMMMQRTHDTNPYTRAALLKVWARLLEKNALPVQRFVSVSDIAVDRLVDKNAAVRRNAAALVGHLLEENPFAGQLDYAVFNKQKIELEKKLDDRINELQEATASEMASDLNEITSGLKGVELSNIMEHDEDEDNEQTSETNPEDNFNQEMKKALKDNALEEFLASPTVQEDHQVLEIKAKLDYCTSALGMIKAIEEAVHRIAAMLQSRIASDVIEALKFFSTAVNFRIHGALEKFKSSFSLIWHQDTNIKQELIHSFRCIYLTNGGTAEHSEYLTSDEIAMNLMHLVYHCNEAELTSMEQIISELFKTKQVHTSVIDCILQNLQLAADSKVGCEGLHQNATPCLHLLAMIAQSDTNNIIDDKIISLIMKTIFPEEKEMIRTIELSAVHAASKCLQMIPSAINRCFDASMHSSSLQQQLDDMIHGFCDVILGNYTNANADDNINEWFKVCEEIIHMIFHTQTHPDRIMSILIRRLYTEVSTVSGSVAMSSLIRLVFVLGQTALNSLVFTENIATYAKKYTPTSTTSQNNNQRDSICSIASELTVDAYIENDNDGDRNNEVDAMEEEMGAAAAADADHERILNHIIEHELIIHNLIGKFMPLISFIVANEGGRYDAAPILRQTAVLTLCRAMSVSMKICDSSLPLLFTALQREVNNSIIRTTIIIALGDLSFRFPNSIEPWTEHMYSRLRDVDMKVRYNALMVITHLVLNDMIKVKGQVCHVAMSLNDSCENIRELAKLFFIKLSERSNNPVYNLLGDIISNFSQDTSLSQTDASMSQTDASLTQNDTDGYKVMEESNVTRLSLTLEQFQSTMQFMLSFVQKDKQADTLLERLLIRLAAASNLQQRRNLAFCIAQLTVTEKGVKKMIESIKNIKEALYDHEIFESFKIALSRVKKTNIRNVGIEIKSAIEEFEQLLSMIHCHANGEEGEEEKDIHDSSHHHHHHDTAAVAGGEDEEEAEQLKKKNASTLKKSKKKVINKKSLKHKRGRRQQSDSESEIEEQEDDFNEASSDEENKSKLNHNQTHRTKRNIHTAAGVELKSTRRIIVHNDDDDAEFI